MREITFADEISKPIEILMFEKLKIGEIGSVGFIIAPFVRHNLYKIPQIFNEWNGVEFDTILKCVKRRLRTSTSSSGSEFFSSLASNASINKPVTQKGKDAEGTSKVKKSLPRPVNLFHWEINITQKKTECKYARVKNYIRKKVNFAEKNSIFRKVMRLMTFLIFFRFPD